MSEGLTKQGKRMLGIVIIIGFCAMAGIASSIWLGPDNVIEEEMEEVIEKESGLDIDLTPDSKEEK